jgi:hypothetical protein
MAQNRLVGSSRQIGEIAVSDNVRGLLIGLRSATNTSAIPELELQQVVDIEMAFAIRFHDDLVATWAARIPVLKERHGLTAGAVVGHTGRLAALKVRGDYIGVGTTGGGLVLAIEKGATLDQLVVLEAGSGVVERIGLADWLAKLLEELGGASGQDPEFRPRLFRPEPMSNAPGRRVRHAKFGDGKVLREIGEGPTRKVQVDFRRVGLKMLQARFLEYVDEG